MVDHRHAQLFFCPLERFGVAALTRKEQRAETRQVVAFDLLAVGVLLANRAEGRWCGEQGADVVLLDHAPECAGVRRPDRLALVEQCRTAVEKRCVHGVGMADRPADVRGGPVDLARIDVIDVLHRPGERHRVAAVVADDPFRLSGGPRRIEDVEGIGCIHRYASRRRGSGQRCVPFDVPIRIERGLEHGPLEHDAALGLRLDHADRGVE